MTEMTMTDRQVEVIKLLAKGLTHAEVGVELGISARTAKAHADAIRHKLGVGRARRIPEAAREAGII